MRWGGARIGVGGEPCWEEEGADLPALLSPLQDSGSGEEQALCLRNRSAFEQQHHHLLHCLEKTTVRPDERWHGRTKGVPLPPSRLPPGMGGSRLMVEIMQGFLEEAPGELSLEGWAREGTSEQLPERKEGMA